MRFTDDSFNSGFQAVEPDAAVPELNHAGEAWPGSGWHVVPHAHRVWELHLQLEGVSHWESRGERLAVGPGALLIAPPGVPHATARRPRGRLHFTWAGFDVRPALGRYPALAPAWATDRCITVRGAESLSEPFRALIREVMTDSPWRSEGLRVALDALIVECSRLLVARRDARMLVPLHPAVRRARQHLDAMPGQRWTLEALGRLGGASPKHLARLFAQQVGVSPHRYLLRRRLDLAKDLLRRSDQRITQLALELGFASSQHFATAFAKAEGCTPREFRAGARPGSR